MSKRWNLDTTFMLEVFVGELTSSLETWIMNKGFTWVLL